MQLLTEVLTNSSSVVDGDGSEQAGKSVVGGPLQAALMGCILGLALLGNAGISWIVATDRRLRRSCPHQLVLNLAAADLLVTYCHMLVHAIWYATDAWRGGEALCKVAKFFSSFGLFASSFITVDVALDRCLAVLRPLGQRQRPFLIKILILNSYFLAALFSVPQVRGGEAFLSSRPRLPRPPPFARRRAEFPPPRTFTCRPFPEPYSSSSEMIGMVRPETSYLPCKSDLPREVV